MNGRPANPKYARNKMLVIGGSGSGKTRFYVKPNLMQMHSSYCVTDPKGLTFRDREIIKTWKGGNSHVKYKKNRTNSPERKLVMMKCKESNSITNQKQLLESYAKRNGFVNIYHYTDDVSGTTLIERDFKR